MKNVFAMTANVDSFVALAGKLEKRDDAVPGLGLGLVHGDPGLGKTRTAIWYAAKRGAVYLRATAAMTVRWLLEEIVMELGESADFKTSDLFRQAVSKLRESRRLIIVDEIDHLASERKVIETLRDLHEKSYAPILMVGMADSERRIARFRHLFDRMLTNLVKFQPLNLDDIGKLTKHICEVELAPSAIEHIAAVSGGRMRPIILQIQRAESIARVNGYKTIEKKHLRNGNGAKPSAPPSAPPISDRDRGDV
jgi:DNA transposition AAA+ family ATPase